VDVAVEGGLVDTPHGGGIFPADLWLVVIVAHDESTAVEVDGLPHRVVVVKPRAVDGNLNAARLILDGHVLVAVAALVGADHHGLDDERLVPAADGVLGAGAERGVHGLDVGDGVVGGRAVVNGDLKLGFFPLVAGGEQASHQS